MRRAAIAASGLLSLAIWPMSFHAAAQAYRSGVDVVSLTVTVVDRGGRPVAGLKPEDFQIQEDGALQTLSYFSPGSDEEGVPLHIGLLFDTSESMVQDLAFSRGAAIRFLNLFPKAADFSLVEFDTDVRAARFSQSEFSRLVERIRRRASPPCMTRSASIWEAPSTRRAGRCLSSTPTAATPRAPAPGPTQFGRYAPPT
jgi:VWFA-related protein